MGLEKETKGMTFVNISEGRLYTKPKGGEKDYFGSLSGTITGIEFAKDTYEGKEFELAKIKIIDGADLFLLQLRTESGYFRGFVNSLKSGKPTERIKISPSYKDEKANIFIQQNGQWLKHFFTKENQGELPQMKRVRFKGQDVWDGTDQTEYWKNWLSSLKWEHELIASYGKDQLPESKDNIPLASDISTPIDGLPF
jgi:hypothetical protein